VRLAHHACDHLLTRRSPTAVWVSCSALLGLRPLERRVHVVRCRLLYRTATRLVHQVPCHAADPQVLPFRCVVRSGRRHAAARTMRCVGRSDSVATDSPIYLSLAERTRDGHAATSTSWFPSFLARSGRALARSHCGRAVVRTRSVPTLHSCPPVGALSGTAPCSWSSSGRAICGTS
jgi:hypothetical protein